MRRSLSLALALGLTLAGCTVGPDFDRPKAPSASAYGSAQDPQAHPAGAPIAAPGEGPAARWWEAFGSKALDDLVDRALANNATLAESNATLAKARERIAAIAGKQLPQVDANGRIEHQQVNLAAFGFDPATLGLPGGNPVFNLYTVGGGVSYDLDLFGRTRRQLEQARAEAETQQRQAEAAHLTIAGRVVTQVLTIAAIRDQIDATNRLLDDDARNVDLTEKRRKGGEGTLVDVLTAQSQLADDRGELPLLSQQLAEARHMLAILIGITPDELPATDFSLAGFTLPSQVPVTLPSALVRKRPDILQAEASLHAATAAIGVATANLYPNLSIGATLSQSAPHIGDVLTPGFRGFDIFGGLTAPIFHGGTLKAEKRGAEDEARAAAARYRQTVLTAFGQVADLLQALGNDAQALADRQAAADVATRSLQLSRRSFEVGNSGVLQIVDTSRTYQRARLGLVDAQRRQYLDVARLYVATAGGWIGTAGAAQPGQ